MKFVLNGRLSEGNINIDNGFEFGAGAFETIYLISGTPLFLNQHLKRLNSAILFFKMDKTIGSEEVLKGIEMLKVYNGVIKIIVSNENTIIKHRENPYTEEVNNKGFSIKTSEVRRNETSPLTFIKSLCYYENILARESVKEKGYDEAFFLNSKGNITEGSSTNLFFINKGQIYTPKVSEGILKGIIRDWVIKNFEVIEGVFSINDLKDADEVFVTNSLVGIMYINKIDDELFEFGEVTKKVSSEYFTLIRELRGTDGKIK